MIVKRTKLPWIDDVSGNDEEFFKRTVIHPYCELPVNIRIYMSDSITSNSISLIR